MFLPSSNIRYLVGVLICSAVSVNGDEFPKDLPRCAVGDVQCLPDVITKYVQNSAKLKGTPSVGLIPFDPLYVPVMNIIQSANSPVNLKLTLREVNVTGYSRCKIIKAAGFGADPKKSKFELWGHVPQLTFIGQYNINGNVLILPIVGNGVLNMTLDNVDFKMRIKVSVNEQKDREEHLHVNKVLVNFNTTRMYLTMDNLFNGDKVLTDSMNSFINQNWRSIIDELKPSLQNAIADVDRDMMQPLFDKFSYKDMWL